ncbi:hypothetical protein ACED30_16315 [Vibrio splendidus]|uniref:Phage protein n=3 Tax=Vibrionaceae TaxID=641 RepID=A0A0H3ZT61_9VIBR|nr:hypothetical protein [Vibrio sp. FF_304]AKN36919.1 hypothetical protein [Enterovibrio norvegicus]AKN39465.1 Phage protein [Vibrio tasmaniensis]
MDKNTQQEKTFTTKRYATAADVLAAHWEIPVKELADSEFGGLDGQGKAVESLSAEDMLDGIELQKVWGFIDGDSCIHYWAALDAELSMVVHFFAHEIGHHTGTSLDDHFAEEMRAEEFGLVARSALEFAFKALGESYGKSVLMSRENPNGWKLESLTEKLREEINRKSLNIASDPSLEAQLVTNNNFQIIGLLMQIEALQRESMVIMSQVGPDQGPTGKPRLG